MARNGQRQRRVMDTEVLKERHRNQLDYLDEREVAPEFYVALEAATEAVSDYVAFRDEAVQGEWCEDFGPVTERQKGR